MKKLIVLHGWQSSKEKWQKVKELLEKEELEVIVPDLPGFKKVNELKLPWNLDNYINWLKDFCDGFSEPFFLLGHSFGGRIAIKFTVKYPEKLKGLILVSAAGIRKGKPLILKIAPLFKKFSFLPGYYFLRKLFYKFVLRKTDYLEAKGVMKETFKKVVAEDLTSYLSKIKIPTLILWGQKDKITPLNNAYLINKEIPVSSLEIIPRAGHEVNLTHPEELVKFIRDFIPRVKK